MALESILHRIYTHQSDVWSYGESNLDPHECALPQAGVYCLLMCAVLRILPSKTVTNNSLVGAVCSTKKT